MGPTGKTILLVEDEALIAVMEVRELESLGYRVIHVLNGEKAIELAGKGGERIDLILMDINLGKSMDGTEAAQEILKHHDIPIVFLSSHTEKEIVEKTEKITSYGYVVKNSGITVLDASIKMAFKLHEAKRGDNHRIRAEAALKERAKELQCLYDVANILRDNNKDFDKLLKAVVNVIPPGMQYPEVTAARIIWEELDVYTDNFRETKWKISRDLMVFGELSGRIEIYYLEEMPAADIGPFLSYETKLLNALADLLEKSTERKISERRLMEYSDRYSALFNNSPDCVYLYDLEGNFVDANQSALDLTGYSRDEISSIALERLLDEDQIEKAYKLTERLLSGISEMEKDEFKLRLKNGSHAFVEITAVPVMRDGKPIMIQGVARDITEKKLADKRLRASEEKFSKAFHSNASLMAISTIDDGRYIDVNNAFLETMGYERDEVIGKSSKELDIWADYSRRNEIIEDLKKKGSASGFEVSVKTKSGEIRHGLFSAQEISLENRRCLLTVMNDVTERRLAEESIKKAAAEKETLLRELQHRVKNNLNIVSALLGFEMDAITDEKAKQVLKNAISRIRAMSSIYEQLYSVDYVDMINLQDYVGDLVNILSEAYISNTSAVRIITEVSPIELDMKRAVPIGLILNELITNSLKYGCNKGSRGVINIDIANSGGEINMRVSDNGPGLPEGFNSDKDGGMGLRIVDMLADQLNGRFSLESPGGVTARVVLPVLNKEELK